MPNDRTKEGPAAGYTTAGPEALRTPGAPDAGTAARPEASGSDAARAGAAPSLLPALTLPTGGGAIRGIGEKLLVNAATGTASLGVPLPISPGRGGFGPQIELVYDSGSGNGPFGLGFNLSVPTITRKTDQGLPRYYDEEESDDYVLSGAEDLVPTRDAAGTLVDIDRGEYVARRYRPRVEGLFARIERWIHRVTRDVHWRVTTKDNTTHVYGTTSASRIVDPKDERRVFSWLLEESRDDKGNIVRYEYKPEDGVGVDPALPREKSRFEGDVFTATAQRYLKRALYCNAAPFAASDFLMELVFDYGEHLEQPTPDEPGGWTVRPDPFSTYRATFEVRTYRLCQRVLMFHRLSAGRAPLLVKSTKLTYDANPSFTYLAGVTQRGHLFESGVWQMGELPTLQLDYTRPVLNDQLSVLSPESLAGLEGGVDGARKQWVDLDGEGIPGVLIDSDHAWYYKSNRGGGNLDPPRVLPTVPSPASLAGGAQQLEDLGGDGQLDLISYDPRLSGYFSRTPEGSFEPLRAFQALPNIDFGDPNLRFIDLDGDGHGDLLLTEEHAFVWYRSKAKGGFDLAERLVVPQDEDQGPAIVFADPEQSVQLADMSGDGLVDIVRVRKGQVCYWPNLGHGRFGKKVTLENSPTFAGPEAFDARRVRFGDVDGSGTSDLFYLGGDGISLFRNESGNRLGAAELIRSLPPVDGLSQLSIVDLLGQGTACLVWSSPLPSPTRPVLYVDLMGGVKPHLMTSVVNNLGAETRLTYAASTKFYLADKAAGTPWLTRLAFPVQVLERIERVDAVSKSRLVSTYSYHHGYFDGVEREFRGFARVEQRDAEEFSTGSPDTELDQPPTRTVTWFHTGAWLERERLEIKLAEEYFPPGPKDILDPSSLLLRDTPLPAGMSIQDEREATRALRGRMLRSEVYGEDGTDKAAIPYLATEQSFEVRLVQSSRNARHGVFFAHERETVGVYSERNAGDPRVSHRLVLDVDDFGNVTRQASLAYERAPSPERITPEQGQARATLTETAYVNQAEEAAFYRVGTQIEQRVFEVTGLALPMAGSGLVELGTLREALDQLDPADDLPFEDEPTAGTQRRLIDRKQQTFYTDDASAEAAFGVVGVRALPYETYQLALTTGQVSQIVSQSLELSGTAFDPAILIDPAEGAYVARTGGYWAHGGHARFDAAHFYLPIEAFDPFMGPLAPHYFVAYDEFDLLVVSSTDPLGNVLSAENDYRVLAPRVLTDPNLNRTEVAFDALGMVSATAVMGKAGEVLGDTLEDPTLLLEYDLLRWQRGEPDGTRKPAFVHTIARERHLHQGLVTRFQHSFAYSDGFGRVVMQKVPAEAGDVPNIGLVDPRWVGTGRTVFNNKGKPVKQYEPFFSATSDYEDEAAIVEHGVTPIIHYDPLDRVVRTDFPDGTFSRVELDAWHQESWDQSDNVLESDWYTDRGSPSPSGPEPSDPEQRAAWLTAQHAQTPTIVHLDTLGRPFLTIAHNRTAGVDAFYSTKTKLDIEGNPLAIHDARQINRSPAQPLPTLEQVFDVLGRRLEVVSADAGTRLAVADVAGKPLRGWDSRDQTLRSRYDALQRQTHLFVARGASERLLSRTVYGEALDLGQGAPPPPVSPAQALNLRGQTYRSYDCAGLMTSEAFDFKGNLLRASRRLATSFQVEPDWIASDALTDPDDIHAALSTQLEAEVFERSMSYDALNRVIEARSPASSTSPTPSITRPVYNEANLLEALHVSVRGATEQVVVTDIDYNARGQRLLCRHANPTAGNDSYAIEYVYDPNTFRLIELKTTRASDGALLQHLQYTFDAVGNITEQRDAANWDPVLSGLSVGGNGQYRYDALYRLVLATGREHPGQQPVDAEPPLWAIPHGNDLQTLQAYREQIDYDEVGNILLMRHLRGTSNNASWSRRYKYAETSNRLEATSMSGDPDQTFSATYEYVDTAANNGGAHGSMTKMPHLEELHWDYADRLQHTVKSIGSEQHTYFTYDLSGQRVRKVYVHDGVVEERIYLGGYEIYRRRSGTITGTLQLERETLHVMDDTRRVAMVETKLVDTGSFDAAPLNGARWRFQLDNHLGSASLELDHAGNVISYEEYHPYGSTAFNTASGGAEVSRKRYRYTGKERDEETGLYYHGARYYAPWLGRWTAADPLGLGDGINVFRYSRDNPIVFSDPGGTQSAEADSGAGDLIELESFVEDGQVYRRYSTFAGDFVFEEAVGSTTSAPEKASTPPEKAPTPAKAPASSAPAEPSPPPEDPSEPSLFEQAREFVLESSATQFVLGLGLGGLAGSLPGGFAVGVTSEISGISEDLPRAYRLGYGVGEAAWGVAQILGGIGGEAAGGALTVAGAGASATGAGALVGVPAVAGGVATIAVSTAAIAEGAADVGVGVSVFMSALKSPGGGGAPTSRVWPKHHPFPKYLGGAAEQTLKKIPKGLHHRFHAALDKWKGGKYARSLGAEHFKNVDRRTVIRDLREFYKTAEDGAFAPYLDDFERAVAETIGR